MEATPNPENDAMRELYEASLNGGVSTLNTLIQRNPLILNRVSLSNSSETPLHIASLLGHLEFCEVLLEKKPSLASERDSEERCPLHLASAEGHTEVLKALVLRNPDICLAKDKDDKLPLHLAAMRGRMGAIEELSRAKPESIRQITDDGSVLHVCVLYNHLEALKFLMQSVTEGDLQQLLLEKDKDGNTVLHLAVRCRQLKTIKYLLSLPEMRTAANTLNYTDSTALDVLEPCPRDYISLTIKHILIDAGVQRSADIATAQQRAPSPAPSTATAAQQSAPSAPNIASQQAQEDQPSQWKRFEKFFEDYLQDQSNWVEKSKEALMVAATVIATMTFQSTISPPGGVWQADTKVDGYDCTRYGFCEAGTAVVGYAWHEDFMKFIFFNTVSFFSSLCVVLVLSNGLPLQNRVMMRILGIAMTIAITFMLLTYMWALGLVSPNHIYYRTRRLGYLLVSVWCTILTVVALIQTARLVIWVKRKIEEKQSQVSSGVSSMRSPNVQ